MGNVLGSIKKFLSNKNTVTILGVLLGIVVLYFGYTWRVKKSTDPTQIPYCNKTLTAGTKVTKADISYITVPKTTVNNLGDIVTVEANIIGKMVNYDSKIATGSFFFSTNLINEEDYPESSFTNIPDGYTIYNLSVDFNSTYANSIMPGNNIDLYVSMEADDGKELYGRFIKQINVLGVKDDKGNNVFENKDDLGTPSLLLFAVPEDLFLLLKKCEKLGIEISPVPRNKNYSESAAATELTNEEIQELIIEQTTILTNECTDLTSCG